MYLYGKDSRASDCRVVSIMVEVNRRLYLDEATGKAGERFGHIQSMLTRVLEAVVDLPIYP